jgi:DNA processing protein
VVYPAENKALFQQIVDRGQGAIISEFVPGVTPEPWRFPARNRLISGSALGVLVLESPLDSGAMITATDAANQGREVFAVPGPIGSGKNSGCHKLIQEGARLVESPDDIFAELGLLPLGPQTDSLGATEFAFRPAPASLDPIQHTVVESLTLEAQHVDQLIGMLGLTASAVNQALTMLEMRGLARRVPGNCFVRAL